MEQYEPMLVQLLLQMLDPDFVCMVRTSPLQAVQLHCSSFFNYMISLDV